MGPVVVVAWLVVHVMVSRLELQTNLLQSFHNHKEGPYKDLFLIESSY